MALLKDSTFHGVISTSNGLTRQQMNTYKSTVTKRLSLEDHQRFSRLLNEARASADAPRRRWIDAVRCMLDDIVQCEHRALDVIHIYYPDNPPSKKTTRAQAGLYLFCCQLWNTPVFQRPGYDPRYRTLFGFLQGKLAKFPQRV